MTKSWLLPSRTSIGGRATGEIGSAPNEAVEKVVLAFRALTAISELEVL
jgi:hypothetical protein